MSLLSSRREFLQTASLLAATSALAKPAIAAPAAVVVAATGRADRGLGL